MSSKENNKPKKHRFRRFLVFSAALAAVWYYNNYTLKTVNISDTSPEIVTPVRIAVISDTHSTGHGITNDIILEHIHDASPDLVFFLGDMYTRKSSWETIQIPIELTQAVVSEGYPVYFITGDHDTSDRYKEAIAGTGAHLLDYKSEDVTVGETQLHIMGIDNVYYSPTFDLTNEFSLEEGVYNILLAHIPNYEKFASFGADLTLCADTHGGMVQLPFDLGPLYDSLSGKFLPEITGSEPVYDKGWFDYDGGRMFITSGIGASPAPVRLNNRPEFVILDLLPQ